MHCRKQLENKASMHWLVVGLSVILTILAWDFSDTKVEEQLHSKFQAESEQVLELVINRMNRYEDALKAGAAFHLVNKNITITVANKLPSVSFPEIALERVFRALIDNAVKHHDKEVVDIVVSSRNLDGTSVEFTVKDDGPGIDSRYHDKVFDMFATLKTKAKTESGGVGLSIAKKTLEQLGGSIKVSSEGRGSEFIFTVPV